MRALAAWSTSILRFVRRRERRHGEVVAAVALAMCLIFARPLVAQQYTMTDLGSNTTANGLIVGASHCPSYPVEIQYHAFIYDVNGPGYGVDLNDAVAHPSDWILDAAYGVNGAGQIVGTFRGSDGGPHGFLLTPGSPNP